MEGLFEKGVLSPTLNVKGVVITFDWYEGRGRLAGVQNFIKINCGGLQDFLKNFWGYETKESFSDFIMNCIMIVLIKLYSSMVLLHQKSLKLMMKNPPPLWLLSGCR